ncbi:hypothetical protein [Clostridium sp. MD294]|uniref:phage tail assembly chaperone n=1 Tax=Clostridium sp. MD294 TaxID=97138 RepID=UPI0002CC40ED|nr:hypothetical protein [Clostridium sp. MD294]NDO46200.1 hypothetical protein [Clostridium sp. MD294]USF30133.1 hypothetical protein C820_001574 [Clostridium sp. MD294]
MIEEKYLLEEKEIEVSKRFIGENGKPLKWRIKALKEKEHQKIKQTKTTEAIEQYWGKLCASCVVIPNLNDRELLKSYGCDKADEVLKEMLTMGEYMILLKAVREQNCFEQREQKIKNDIKKQ